MNQDINRDAAWRVTLRNEKSAKERTATPRVVDRKSVV